MQQYFVYCNENMLRFTRNFPGRVYWFGNDHPGKVSTFLENIISGINVLQHSRNVRSHTVVNMYKYIS